LFVPISDCITMMLLTFYKIILLVTRIYYRYNILLMISNIYDISKRYLFYGGELLKMIIKQKTNNKEPEKESNSVLKNTKIYSPGSNQDVMIPAGFL